MCEKIVFLVIEIHSTPFLTVSSSLDSRKKLVSSLQNKCSDRFKVVKIESTEPFARGRWKCMDFLDQSYDRIVHYNSVMFRTSETNLNQSKLAENQDSNIDLQSSMLQIFQQQNSRIAQGNSTSSANNTQGDIAQDDNIAQADHIARTGNIAQAGNIAQKTKEILQCDTYLINRNGNYVLLPGMVSSSLIGIKYPFELNFLPISTSGNLENLVCESEYTSLTHFSIDSIVNNPSEKFESASSVIEDQLCVNYLENQVALETKRACQSFDNRQMNQTKMSTGTIHYIQNGEIQSGETRIKNNQEIGHEVFNNYNNGNNINVPVNSNVIQNMTQNSSNSENVYQSNIQDSGMPHKEIIDQSYINQNNVQPTVPNVVYQQQIYNKEMPQEPYKNIPQNVSEAPVCVPNIPAQNFNSEVHQTIYQPVSEIKPQIINKPVTNQICTSNLTVRTQTYDVMPDMKPQNSNIYNGNAMFNPINTSNVTAYANKNPEFEQNFNSHRHEEVQYCTQIPKKNFDVNQGMSQSMAQNYYEYQEGRIQQNIVKNMEGATRKNFEQPNQNKNEYLKSNVSEKNMQTKKDDYSRPASAKFTQEHDAKREMSNKFATSNINQYSYIPEIIMNDNVSQSSMPLTSNVHSNPSNNNLNQVNSAYVENGTMLMDSSQIFMPAYSISPNQTVSNPIYVPVFSNNVQIPYCLNAHNSNTALCEQVLSETALNRKPIGYQRVWMPQNIASRRTNQYTHPQSQPVSSRPQMEGINFESCYNNDSFPRTDSYTSAIDVKIEALMDLVKKHLKFTIMEDVHCLKQRILTLKERVAQLEYENELLRSHNDENKKFKDKLG